MIRKTLSVFSKIFLALLILATAITWIITALSCLLPPFDLLTFGNIEGSRVRYRLKMMKGAVVVESWALQDASAASPSQTIHGMLGFFYGEGLTRIRPSKGDAMVRSSTEVYRRRV